MIPNSFREDQVNIENQIIKISQIVQFIRMSNGGSDKASNNDSRSKGLGLESQFNKLNTNSIKEAEESLVQLFNNNEDEKGSFKRENTSSYQGTIIKRKKMSLIKDNTDVEIMKEPQPLVKKDSLFGYFKPIQKPKLQLKKRDCVVKQRSSQKKRQTDNLADKVKFVEDQIVIIQQQNKYLNQRLDQQQQQVQKQQMKKRSAIEDIYRQLLQYQTIKNAEMNSLKQQEQRIKNEPQQLKLQYQYKIYEQHFQQNNRAHGQFISKNYTLQRFDKNRKSYMKQIFSKINNKLEKCRENKKNTFKQIQQKRPSINFMKYEIHLQKFLITGYKYTDDTNDEYYDVIDLSTMKTCLGKLKTTLFKSLFMSFQTVKGQLLNVVNNIKYDALLPQPQVISYVNEDVYGIMNISEVESNYNTYCEILQKYGNLTENNTVMIMKKVWRALNYLTQRKIQQVITPSDIVIRYGDVKICNYGFQSLNNFEAVYKTLHKTQRRYYYPPQFFRTQQSNNSVITEKGIYSPLLEDVKKINYWSFGILFYQCLFGQKPFQYDSDSLKDFSFVQQLIFPFEVSQQTKSIIRQCLSPNPQKRISINNDLFKI